MDALNKIIARDHQTALRINYLAWLDSAYDAHVDAYIEHCYEESLSQMPGGDNDYRIYEGDE